MVFLMFVFLCRCGKKNLLLIFQRGFPGHCKVGLNWMTSLILMATERSQALPGSQLLAQILGISSSIYWRSPEKEPQCYFCLTREETEAYAQRPGWDLRPGSNPGPLCQVCITSVPGRVLVSCAAHSWGQFCLPGDIGQLSGDFLMS